MFFIIVFDIKTTYNKCSHPTQLSKMHAIEEQISFGTQLQL